MKWENVFAAFTLIIMAGYSLESIAERWLSFTIARRQSRRFQSRIAEALYFNRAEEAFAIPAMYPKSPVAYIVHASLNANPVTPFAGAKVINPSMQERQRAMVIKTADLKRRLWTLSAIGWTAPLVGLYLATLRVTEELRSWQYTEGTSFGPYAGGIAYATWGLSFSLVIAVPTIWAHKYFCRQAETFTLEMDKLSLAIIEQFTDRRGKPIRTSPVARYTTQPLGGPSTPQTSR